MRARHPHTHGLRRQACRSTMRSTALPPLLCCAAPPPPSSARPRRSCRTARDRCDLRSLCPAWQALQVAREGSSQCPTRGPPWLPRALDLVVRKAANSPCEAAGPPTRPRGCPRTQPATQTRTGPAAAWKSCTCANAAQAQSSSDLGVGGGWLDARGGGGGPGSSLGGPSSRAVSPRARTSNRHRPR